jgi:hypothetical protein
MVGLTEEGLLAAWICCIVMAVGIASPWQWVPCDGLEAAHPSLTGIHVPNRPGIILAPMGSRAQRRRDLGVID